MGLWQWLADALNKPSYIPQNNNPIKAAEIAIAEKNSEALTAATNKILPFLKGNAFIVETLSVIADKFMEMNSLKQTVEQQDDVRSISEAVRISRVILAQSADREYKQKAADLVLANCAKLTNRDDRIDALIDVARYIEPGVSYRAPKVDPQTQALSLLETEINTSANPISVLRAYGRVVENSSTGTQLEKLGFAGVYDAAKNPSVPEDERFPAYCNVFRKASPDSYYKHTTAHIVLERFGQEDKGLTKDRAKTSPQDRIAFYQDLFADGNEHYQTAKTTVDGFISSVQSLVKPQDRIAELTKTLPQSYENTLLHKECVRALYKNADALPTLEEKAAVLKEAKEFCTFDKNLRTEIIRKLLEIQSVERAPEHDACIRFVKTVGKKNTPSYGWVPGPM